MLVIGIYEDRPEWIGNRITTTIRIGMIENEEEYGQTKLIALPSTNTQIGTSDIIGKWLKEQQQFDTLIPCVNILKFISISRNMHE